MTHARLFNLRPARMALGFLALANLAFFLLFLGFLGLATVKARAETPACTGIDMIAEMQREDPQRLARIEAEAAGEVNGKGLLWRIEAAGAAPSYLFGTVHVADPRVTTLPASAKAAFDAAGTVAIETLDVLDPAIVTALMLERPDLMMFTDERNLVDLIPEEDRALVTEAFDRRGIPLGSLRKTKPWIVAALVALPQCELARKAAGVPVLDLALAEQAKTAGKRLEGLESMASQLEAMASLPMDFHIEGLVETVRLGDTMDDIVETMLSLYVSGRVGMFWPFFHEVLPGAGRESDGYADFQEAMIEKRNGTMAASARPLIEAGGAFIAVGALHLPGANGVVEHLKRMGFAATAAD